jgi:hypothetical protein
MSQFEIFKNLGFRTLFVPDVEVGKDPLGQLVNADNTPVLGKPG